ncbi:MAG TPA: molybdate ABC transporter substrate-binding protein [Planctomycetaceae bacterium]|nr:molybdate ABC transporter substrate-binding protein [Planctomycetaceae bacterium]
MSAEARRGCYRQGRGGFGLCAAGGEERCRSGAGAGVLLLWLAVVSAGGCSAGSDGERATVVVFAAASTGDAVDELSRRFERSRAVQVRANYAATSTLAQQVTNAADADVFLSANTFWADYLEQQGLVAQGRDVLANRLVIVVPADSGLQVRGPEDLLDARVRHIAVADPEAVPAGIYARRTLESLGLWGKLKGKLASVADVRRALACVETAAAEAGLVYATDARASRAVRIAVALDPKLAGPIRYRVLLLKQGAQKPAAKQYFAYLFSPEAADVFRRHGFEVLVELDE